MKKLIIVILLMLFFVIMVSADLSDDTNELVNDLRWKHYGYGTLYSDSSNSIDWDFVYEWVSITFDDEDGILYIET